VLRSARRCACRPPALSQRQQLQQRQPCGHRSAATLQASSAGLQYGPSDEDDDEEEKEEGEGEPGGYVEVGEGELPDWAPQLGPLLLTHAVRGVFRQPPPPPPAHVSRRLRELGRLRGTAELELEWKALCDGHEAVHGDPRQGQRYRRLKQAHRIGPLQWSILETEDAADGTSAHGLATAAAPATATAVGAPHSAAAAEAYAWRRFVPSHAHHVRVMQETLETLGESFAPRRVIDFGCGAGSGLAAAAQVWPDSVQELVGVDNSQGMLAAADILLGPDETDHTASAEGVEGTGDGEGEGEGNDETVAPNVRLELSLAAAMQPSSLGAGPSPGWSSDGRQQKMMDDASFDLAIIR